LGPFCWTSPRFEPHACDMSCVEADPKRRLGAFETGANENDRTAPHLFGFLGASMELAVHR